MVANTVHSGLIAFERRRKTADDLFDTQMATLVLEVNDIKQQVAQMADQIQHAVIEKTYVRRRRDLQPSRLPRR
jgi:hypothetical protein